MTRPLAPAPAGHDSATPDRVRILHVLEALEGGTSRHLIDVVTHVTGCHHIAVVPPHRVGAMTDEIALPRLRAAGADVRLLRMHRTPWSPANAVAVGRLRRLIQMERPHIVHAHSSIGGLLARVATTGTGVPIVYTPNGITQSRAGIAVERMLRSRTDMLVAVSSSEADLALKLGIIDRDRLAIIPNGIESGLPPSPLDLRAEMAIPADAPLVGTITRLVPQKSPEDFVAACAVVAEHIPNAHFVLIGGGALDADVEAAIDRSGLRGTFHRIGALTGAAGVLGQLDVFALSSRFEGGPYAPLEAMRAGTAVVLTDVVGNRDTVDDGVTGLIVPHGDPRALGEAVVGLLRDPEARSRMADAARSRVATSFDVRTMGAALDAVYAKLRSQRLNRG